MPRTSQKKTTATSTRSKSTSGSSRACGSARNCK